MSASHTHRCAIGIEKVEPQSRLRTRKRGPCDRWEELDRSESVKAVSISSAFSLPEAIITNISATRMDARRTAVSVASPPRTTLMTGHGDTQLRGFISFIFSFLSSATDLSPLLLLTTARPPSVAVATSDVFTCARAAAFNVNPNGHSVSNDAFKDWFAMDAKLQ